MKGILRKILVYVTVLTATLSAAGQMPIMFRMREPEPPDSADVEHAEKKHFWRAAAMMEGVNAGLLLFDRFVIDKPCSHISFKTIKKNFTQGFKWDNDPLGTNMFAHPYNGSLFYNAARSNGFNYWQSSMFAIAGSATWEFICENEPPSTNDIISTPIGGIAVGEVLYRMSDLLINDTSTGAERGAREAGVFLLNPMRGLTRLITGDMWKHRATTGRQFGTPPVALQLSLGGKVLEYSHGGVRDFRGGACLGVTFEYGDRFEVHSAKPYDYFTMHANLNFISHQPMISRLNIEGRLIARELLDSHPDDLSIGMYQNFDYWDSDTISSNLRHAPYKLGVPASVGVGMMYRHTFSPRMAFDADLHFNGVILGGILTDYYNLDQRNYNLGSGFSLKAGVQLVWDKEKFCVSATHNLYRLYTWDGYPPTIDLSKVTDENDFNVQGDRSAATFGITEINAQLRVARRLYIGLQLCHLFRHTSYKYYPDVSSDVFVQSLMLIYKL